MTKTTTAKALSFYAHLAVDHSTDSIVVTDVQGGIEWVNNAFRTLTGYTLEEIRGERPGSFLQGPKTDAATVKLLQEALAERRPLRTEILNYTKTGEGYWIELEITPIFDNDGRHTHFMALARDISSRRKLEERTRDILAAEEYRQSERKLLTQTSEWLYAAKSLDELMRVAERALQTLMPEASGHLYIYSNSRDTLDLAASWGDEEGYAHFAADECWGLRRGRAYSFGRHAIQFPCGHVNREDAPYFCLPIVAHGETIGLLHIHFSSFDLSIMKREMLEDFLQQRWETALICSEQISLAVANVRLRMELQEQSIRDQLTGLWNRRWFLETAQRDLGKALRTGTSFGLISLDVDHFKKFNDHHGHDAGDLVLREVGGLMFSVFGDDMSPCRLGGEEFVVICPGQSPETCLAAAETFRLEIQKLDLRHGGSRLPPITVSQGLAFAPDDSQGLLDLMKCADQALYAAKAGGRDCIRLFSELGADQVRLAPRSVAAGA